MAFTTQKELEKKNNNMWPLADTMCMTRLFIKHVFAHKGFLELIWSSFMQIMEKSVTTQLDVKSSSRVVPILSDRIIIWRRTSYLRTRDEDGCTLSLHHSRWVIEWSSWVVKLMYNESKSLEQLKQKKNLVDTKHFHENDYMKAFYENHPHHIMH